MVSPFFYAPGGLHNMRGPMSNFNVCQVLSRSPGRSNFEACQISMTAEKAATAGQKFMWRALKI